MFRMLAALINNTRNGMIQHMLLPSIQYTTFRFTTRVIRFIVKSLSYVFFDGEQLAVSHHFCGG